MQSCFFSTSRSSNDASKEPDQEGSNKLTKDKSIKKVPQEDFLGPFSFAEGFPPLLMRGRVFFFRLYILPEG